MKSFNFTVLGDISIADELGKKGTSADITFYERKTSDRILTFIVPSAFPDKIQPLVQSISLAEYAILNATKIDKALGEQIIALDNSKMERGFIISNWFDDEVRKVIKSTVLEKYEFLTLQELKQRLENLEEVRSEGPAKVLIDASFEVKGVGSVVLGVVRRGEIKPYDEVTVFPRQKPVSIRSVQMHDDDVEAAPSPARVGLSIKGLNAKEIDRGDVIGATNSLKVGSEIKIKFEKSRFYKGELNPSSVYHLCIGLQIKPFRIMVGNDLTASSDKPFAYETGEHCLMLDLNSQSTRIVGNGIIL